MPVLRKEPPDLHDVRDLHREEEVGFFDVAPVETMRTMSVQIHPEAPRALHGGRVGRTIRFRIESRGPDLKIGAAEAVSSQELGCEDTPDHVPKTHEHDRLCPRESSRE